MRDLLAAKGVETFAQLKTEWDDPKYAYRLQVIASDVSARELLVLPRDAAKLGIAPDELEVALAVRMSMSIPIFFEPVRIENPETNHEHVIVDGGMLSNFPVWLFDSGDPRSRTGRPSACCSSSPTRKCRSRHGCPRPSMPHGAPAGSSRCSRGCCTR